MTNKITKHFEGAKKSERVTVAGMPEGFQKALHRIKVFDEMKHGRTNTMSEFVTALLMTHPHIVGHWNKNKGWFSESALKFELKETSIERLQ